MNRQGSGTETYAVSLTYGGLLTRQHLLTPIANADGSRTHHVLPFQRNLAGDDDHPSSDDHRYRDYHAERWYDFEASFRTSALRAASLRPWVSHYNHQRPHRALGKRA